jgi:tetratricopeptide (TPR) repeat protein
MKPGDVPKAVLAEARSLEAQGRFEEALEKHLWFHEHALEHNEALAGVRLSFALTAWVALGEKYPPARQALVSLRDAKMAAIEEGKGSWMLFHDVAAINGYLQEEAKTVDLFRSIHERHPELARQCYQLAEDVLVASGDYEICLEYIGPPEAKFETIRQLRQISLEIAEENPALGSPEAGVRAYAEMRFVSKTRQLLEILTRGGRTQDADKIRQLAREVRGRIPEFGSDEKETSP